MERSGEASHLIVPIERYLGGKVKMADIKDWN